MSAEEKWDWKRQGVTQSIVVYNVINNLAVMQNKPTFAQSFLSVSIHHKSNLFHCHSSFISAHLPAPYSLPPSLPHLPSLQRWCMHWSLVTSQPSFSGCTLAGPSITPEPKTSKTSYVSIVCRRSSSSVCWNISRPPGRSTTALIPMRYCRNGIQFEPSICHL